MPSMWVVVGLNHSTASVDMREAICPRPDETGSINPTVQSACGLLGTVVLSTCSRFEVYAECDEDGPGSLRAWFSRRAGRDMATALYMHKGADAVRHLCRVAGGLDSWIVGETEILGQVKTAYQAACAQSTATRFAHLAFQRALYAGKKIRSETCIVGGIASIGGAAAVLSRSIFKHLSEKNILVFGAGAMAASTVRHLRSKGAGAVWVSNRSLPRAQALAADLGGEALTIEDGLRRLDEADIAIFSTASDRHLLDGPTARALSRRRGGRALFIIDISVPRNVAPEASEAPSIYLYHIDDLRRVVEQSLARRGEDIVRAEAIAAEEAAGCWDRMTSVPPHSVPPQPAGVTATT